MIGGGFSNLGLALRAPAYTGSDSAGFRSLVFNLLNVCEGSSCVVRCRLVPEMCSGGLCRLHRVGFSIPTKLHS